MIWIIGLVVVSAALFLGVFYLISRIRKMGYVKKYGRGNRGKEILLALLPLTAVFLPIALALNMMNMMICLLHLIAIWLIADIINIFVERIRKKKSDYMRVSGIAVLCTVVYLCMAWFLANNVWRTEYTVTTDKLDNNLKIVQIADSHIGAIFSGKEFGEYTKRMQEDEPDIVVITGDYVDDDTDRQNMIDACAALSELKPAYGVYYCFGNHDKGYYGSEHRGFNTQDLKNELEKNGVIVLEDESVLVDDSFYIIGRKDLSENSRGNRRKTMEELTAGLDKDKYMIVLDHQPYDYEEEERVGVDMVLSGHTHGGQLIPITYIGEWTGMNAMRYGHEKRGNTDFFVTSGIADWAIKFKTGTKSEYVVINVNEL